MMKFRIYIEGLPGICNSEHLRIFFSSYAEIVGAGLVRRRRLGTAHDLGFVEVKSIAEAQVVRAVANSVTDSRALAVVG